MQYDYMGRRFAKACGNATQLFVYNEYLQISELDQDSNIVKTYVWDPTAGQASRPFAMITSDDTYFYTHDANKNVTELTTASGLIAAHYEYSPFGALTNVTGVLANTNPFTFSSEYLDAELGIIYYNYRHYNPAVGKWISRDPIEEKGGYNLYAMVRNNVIKYNDILGKGILDDIIEQYKSCLYPIDIKDMTERQHSGKTDKFKHCFASCHIARKCGAVIAFIIGLGKEGQDSWDRIFGDRAQDWKDSWDDLVANQQCITWKNFIPGMSHNESCNCCCERKTK